MSMDFGNKLKVKIWENTFENEINKLIRSGEFRLAAQKLVENKRVEEAIDLLKNAGEKSIAAELSLKIGKLNDAVELYTEINDNTKVAEVLLSQGNKIGAASSYIKAQQYREAVKILIELNELDIAIPLIAEHINFDEAISLALDNKKLAVALELCVEKNELDKAVKILLDSNMNEDAVDFLLNYSSPSEAAKLAEDLGLKQKAIEIYIQQKEFELAAIIYQELNEFLNAADLFQKADNYKSAAECYLKINKIDEAIESLIWDGSLKEAGNLAEKNSLFIKAAQIFTKTGDIDKAVSLFCKANKVIESIKLLIGNKQIGSAIELAKKENIILETIDILLENDFIEEAANCYLILGKPLDAINVLRENKIFDKAATFAKDNKFYDIAADLFLIVGDLDKAVEFYKITKNHQMLIEVYTQQGKLIEAANEFELLGDYQNAALLFEKNKNYEKAAENYERINEFEKANHFWLELKNASGFLRCLSSLNNKEKYLYSLEQFKIEEIVNEGIKYDLEKELAMLLVKNHHQQFDQENIVKLIELVYNKLQLDKHSEDEDIKLLKFLFDLKFENVNAILDQINEEYLNYKSQLLKGMKSDVQSKKVIFELCRLNGLRMVYEGRTEELIREQLFLFEEYENITLGDYQDLVITKYKIAHELFEQNFDELNRILSELLTKFPESNQFIFLIKRLVQNLQNNNEEPVRTLENFWRGVKKIYVENMDDIKTYQDIKRLIMDGLEFTPEYLIYKFWRAFYFLEDNTQKVFNSVFTRVINIINNAIDHKSEENVLLVKESFLEFYEKYNIQFSELVDREYQIETLSNVCILVKEIDPTMHISIIDLLENKYDYDI